MGCATALLIFDGAGWHSSPKLVVPENIVLMPLPPYAPKLNSVENVWDDLRSNFLSHCVWDTSGRYAKGPKPKSSSAPPHDLPARRPERSANSGCRTESEMRKVNPESLGLVALITPNERLGTRSGNRRSCMRHRHHRWPPHCLHRAVLRTGKSVP